MSKEWEEAYHAGVFTEFMEQRAGGHTSMDGKMYRRGLLDVKKLIAESLDKLDFINDPEATDKQQELQAMDISCDAAILFAERHAELAEQQAKELGVRNEEFEVHFAAQNVIVNVIEYLVIASRFTNRRGNLRLLNRLPRDLRPSQ